MREEFFLKGRKYKFFLGFHFLVVILYALYTANTLKSYNSSSYDQYYKESISLNIAKYSFYIVINLICTLLIYYKAKKTKIILNIFAGLIGVLVLYAQFTLFKTYENNTYYNFVILFNSLVIVFITFYIFYLNINKKEKNIVNEIEEIGKHED
ncbi:hypothetical protein [Chryseobacterium oryctis]|uniref:Uncharacterized protein n=1 Tax=Chryseobacterium oryctis TaxID=2952618 RepID=A0ABT3HSR5_9FLAO|nr:hypothetical protein [Chryseobacterium oryctis]MCW3162825.1 hypothetical protein [Chryseobacterium oryctis]